jgi:hypothetical protein
MLDGTIYGLREGQEFTQQKAMRLSEGSPTSASTRASCLCCTLLWARRAKCSGSLSPLASASKMARASDSHHVAEYGGELASPLLQQLVETVD